jgi:methionine-rich copper-binding protein CopC
MNLRILACALACVAAPAGAHAFLDHANPGAGAVLHAAPKTLMLTFSDDVDADSSNVVVVDASGRRVAGGHSMIGGNCIMTPLPPLGPGRYRVEWHAESMDDHRTQGAYVFLIKP